MAVSRRTVLKTLAVPAVNGLAGLGAVGCGSSAPSVNVAVTWIDWELQQFQRVLEVFQQQTRIGYQLLSMGDDTGAFLNGEVTAAAQPDVALVSSPGLVLGASGRLAPVPWPGGDALSWRQLLAAPGGGQYGVWFKAAYESMVWHTDELALRTSGWSWDAFAGKCLDLVRRGRPPLSIGAASGWVLALWFANVLLSLDPAGYRALARRYRAGRPSGPGPTWSGTPAVGKALGMLADLWSIKGIFPGGPERALVTQFDQSVLDVFGTGEAAMVAGADFYWPIITQSTSFDRGRVRWTPFPPAKPGAQSPIVVAGDAAVLFQRPGGQERLGRRLLAWLGSPDAQAIWAKTGGLLSISSRMPVTDYPYHRYPRTMSPAALIGSVRNPAAQFDMADQLGGPLGGDDGQGSWKIFTDFFTAVTRPHPSREDAISAVVSALDGGASGA